MSFTDVSRLPAPSGAGLRARSDGSHPMSAAISVRRPVPEPSTWVMLALGFAGLGFVGLRSRKTRRLVCVSFRNRLQKGRLRAAFSFCAAFSKNSFAVPRCGSIARDAMASNGRKADPVHLLDAAEPPLRSSPRCSDHTLADRSRGAVRQPRHPGGRSHRGQRLWTFAALRRVVRRGDARSYASTILAGADVALAAPTP